MATPQQTLEYLFEETEDPGAQHALSIAISTLDALDTIESVVQTSLEDSNAAPQIALRLVAEEFGIEFTDPDREPTDDEINNRYGVEGGIPYSTDRA